MSNLNPMCQFDIIQGLFIAFKSEHNSFMPVLVWLFLSNVSLVSRSNLHHRYINILSCHLQYLVFFYLY